jgi:glycosyltransferase involved in cell wall biosynthesis
MTEHEGKIRAYIDRFIPCTPTTYIAVSDAVQTSLQKHKRLHAAPCLVIKNGIDAQIIKQAHPVEFPRTITHQNSFIIGAVGRLITEKNYAILLHSFAELHARYPQTHLMIVGSGPEEQKLHQLAHDLQITESVSWVGNRLAHPYYQFFDCYVQPSRSEGLSIALLEALSCSLPVIVTGKNKSHEVIQHNFNGLIIEPNDTSALFSALEIYFTNPTVREQCGNNGYNTVTESFSMHNTAQAYIKLFQEITAHRS